MLHSRDGVKVVPEPEAAPWNDAGAPRRLLPRFLKTCLLLAGFTLCAAAIAGAAEVKNKDNGTKPASKARAKKSYAVVPIPPVPRAALIEVLGPADDLTDLIASETGIYALKHAESENAKATDRVVKWQNTPGKQGWLENPLPTRLSTFAPFQLHRDTGIKVHWAGIDRVAGRGDIYMHLSHVEKDDIHMRKIVTSGGNMAQHWVISKNDKAYIKASGGGLGREALMVFDPGVSTKDGALGLGHVAVADVRDNSLYAAAGNVLYRFSPMRENTGQWKLPASINTLLSAMDSIWIGSGSQLYRLQDGKLTFFADLPGVLGFAGPIFCISNLDIFAANGTVYRSVESGPAPTPKPFVAEQEHLLTPDKFLGVAMVKSGMLAAGIYCADNDTQDLYTMAVNPAQPGNMSLIRMVPLH